MFKANLWFAGVHQGLTVEQNWVEVTDLRKEKENIDIYIYAKRFLKKMRKKTRRFQTRNELQYEPLLHSHLWFPKAAGYSRTDLRSRYREQKLHVGHKCAVVEHAAETIFIYASKTLDAELD